MSIESRLKRMESRHGEGFARVLWLDTLEGETREQALARILAENGVREDDPVMVISWAEPVERAEQ